MKFVHTLKGRVILIAIVVAILVAIPVIALSYAYTATPLAQVTVNGGEVTFEQGTVNNQGTIGDIGPSPQQFAGTAEGYPITVSAGSHLRIGIQLVNSDTVAHHLDAIHVGSPFQLYNTSAPLPLEITGGSDATFYVTLTVPPDSGVYSFDVTVVSYS
jgi:hypothetical protein